MSKSRKNKKRASTAAQKPAEVQRRDVLKLMRNGALGLVALGGGSAWAVTSFRTYTAEHDLTRIGRGDPVIVQIHDPQCPMCTSLQKQTRSALKEFSECGLTYLVADIKTDVGAAFAARHGVPHVTLMLFDGQGRHVETVSGVHTAAQLAPMFRALKAMA